MDQSTKIMLTGGWWTRCPGTSSYAAAFIATDTGGAVVAGVKGFDCRHHINMITTDHQSPSHVRYFVDVSCTSFYGGVAKLQLCDGACCFSTSPSHLKLRETAIP